MEQPPVKNFPGEFLMEKIKSFFRENLKKILIICACFVALLFTVIVFVLFVKGLNPSNNRILVYAKDGRSVIRIKDKERILSDTGAAGFRCDEKNKRVFFRVASASSQDLYDLYYVENRNGEITKPKLIDFGIKENFSVSDGKVYYLKINEHSRTSDGCVCDVSENKISVFSDNVSEIITLRDSERFYFTKMHSLNKVLYSFDNGEPKEVCRDLLVCKAYNDCERPHIIYEKKSASDSSLIALYVAYFDALPQLISDSAVKVMLDEYEAGGNLYYMSGTQESIMWTSVISDNFALNDEKLQKPQRSAFSPFFSDSSDYNEKSDEYNKKLARDEIRDALNQNLKNGSINVPLYTVFSYNANGSTTVAVNVDPSRIYSYSHFGQPKLVYERTRISSSDTDVSALAVIAESGEIENIVEYAESVIKKSVKSYGISLAVGSETDNKGYVCYPLSEYTASGTQFVFSADGSRLFAFIKGKESDKLNIYTNSLGTSMKPDESEAISTDISAYKIKDDSVIYMKTDAGKGSGDVFVFNESGNTRLSGGAGAFFLDSDKNIIVLKNYKSDENFSTVDLYLCNNGVEKLIGSNVIESSYIFEKNGYAAFICNTDSGRRVLCTSCKGKTVEISDNVSDILLFV